MSIIKYILQLLVIAFFKIYFLFNPRPALSSPMQKTVDLYKRRNFSETFQFIRLWDAPYETLDKLIPIKGIIIDLGCGDGLLANYIAISRPKTKVVGIDINKSRIKETKKGVKNTQFLVGNIVNKKVPKADVILFVHVLHHLQSKKDQEKIILECNKKLNKKGKLIICEIVEKPLLKFLFTGLIDRIAVPILFEGRLFNNRIFYRKNVEWKKLFSNYGFKVKTISAHKGKPFSHIIYVCTKP